MVRTESVGWTKTSLTTPARGARMLCSIFMASTTQTSWPSETRSPGRTKMEMTRPGIGERMIVSEAPGALVRLVGWGVTLLSVSGPPRRGRERARADGRSISTKYVSPSTVTSTGELDRSPTSTLYQLLPTRIRSVVTANLCSPECGRGAVHGGRGCAMNWLRRWEERCSSPKP